MRSGPSIFGDSDFDGLLMIIIKIRQQPCLKNVKSRRKLSSLSFVVNFARIIQSQTAKERNMPLVQNSAAILLWDESFWRFCELCRWQVSTYLRPHCEGVSPTCKNATRLSRSLSVLLFFICAFPTATHSGAHDWYVAVRYIFNSREKKDGSPKSCAIGLASGK